MTNFLPEKTQTCSEKYLKIKLKKKYQNSIIISSLAGKQSIVSFKGNCEKLLIQEWSKDDTEDRIKIVMAAARIIKEDIRGMSCNLQEYPSLDNIKTGGVDKLPTSLNSFFNELVLKDKKELTAYTTKVAALQNVKVSLVRVRYYVSPTMFGLGTMLHRKYAPKHLIDILSTLGVSISYSECLNFENSAIKNVKESIPDKSFMQFVFDNADFNTRTIDGYGTFHSMGIVCISPEPPIDSFKVPRSKHRIPSNDIGSFGNLSVQVSFLKFKRADC